MTFDCILWSCEPECDVKKKHSNIQDGDIGERSTVNKRGIVLNQLHWRMIQYAGILMRWKYDKNSAKVEGNTNMKLQESGWQWKCSILYM